jgi:hypothetical protein
LDDPDISRKAKRRLLADLEHDGLPTSGVIQATREDLIKGVEELLEGGFLKVEKDGDMYGLAPVFERAP